MLPLLCISDALSLCIICEHDYETTLGHAMIANIKLGYF